MTGYSLSFFATGRYSTAWWDTLTPEEAERAAARAKQAGCEPNPEAALKFGIATAWCGPDLAVVLRALGAAGNEGG